MDVDTNYLSKLNAKFCLNNKQIHDKIVDIPEHVITTTATFQKRSTFF